MMKYVVCGTSVEDVDAGVDAMKMAIANGATCGVGGSTMADVEKGLDAMKQAMSDMTKSTSLVCVEDECDEEDEDEVSYREGYMALTEDYDEISDLWDSPENAMSDALCDGYSLDEIEIHKVRVYDDNSIDVID